MLGKLAHLATLSRWSRSEPDSRATYFVCGNGAIRRSNRCARRVASAFTLLSNEHIDRFRLLAAATKHGRTISLVAGLATDALRRLVTEDETERPAPAADSSARTHAEHAQLAEAALEHARALDGSALNRELLRTIARHGIPVFLEDVVPTLMYRGRGMAGMSPHDRARASRIRSGHRDHSRGDAFRTRISRGAAALTLVH